MDDNKFSERLPLLINRKVAYFYSLEYVSNTWLVFLENFLSGCKYTQMMTENRQRIKHDSTSV